MANKIGISTALKRDLKEGKEYSKLIPRVRCERTNLGEGDTFHTVDAMRDWIKKFRFQTEKLAPKLVGRDLKETVDNIYNFLYSHIQYEADGALQQLRSPACTWMQRSSGVDCKSFSVFASSILSNLGIDHSIRQVRQPNFYPEEFTHVYVVVPKNQNSSSNKSATFVLDATKHRNVEGSYIEKVDLNMNLKHIGLNAPQDERTQRIIENFDKFCAFLLQKGVPVESVNAIRDRVNTFTAKGKDPDIKIVPEGLTVQGLTFPLELREYVPFLAIQQAFGGPKGLGFASAFGRSGLGFSFGDAFSKLSSGSFTGGSTGGNPTAGIVDAGMELAAGAIPFGNIIKGLLDNLDLSGNISNVLKYGLSSWGASTTPEKKKAQFGEMVYPWLQKELSATTMDNVAEKMTAIDIMLRGNAAFAKGLLHNHSRAKSTRLANDWATKEYTRLANETLEGFNKKFQEIGVRVTKRQVDAKSSEVNRYPITNLIKAGHDLKKDRYWDQTQFYVYSVDKSSLKNWNNGLQQQDNGSTGNGSVGNIKPEKESSNTGLIVGGIAAAALPLFFMIKNKK